MSTENFSLLSTSTGNELFPATHNVFLLSLMWLCMQIAFIVTQPLLLSLTSSRSTASTGNKLFFSFPQCPYYRSSEHAIKLLLSSHKVSLLSTSTGNQLFSAQQTFPIIAQTLLSLRWTCTQTDLSSHNVSLLSKSTGNKLFSASHNVSLLSLMWTCTQIAFLVTQPLPIIAHVNMKHCKR